MVFSDVGHRFQAEPFERHDRGVVVAHDQHVVDRRTVVKGVVLNGSQPERFVGLRDAKHR